MRPIWAILPQISVLLLDISLSCEPHTLIPRDVGVMVACILLGEWNAEGEWGSAAPD